MKPDNSPLLSLEDYSLSLDGPQEPLAVVHRVSLTIAAQETVGLVGESGCGKSLTALTLLGLLPQKIVHSQSGSLLWHGKPMLNAGNREWRRIRGKEISMIFQEPMTALNPVLRIGEQLEELLKEHTDQSSHSRRERSLSLLRQVGLREVESKLDWYPHQFSGGMRQRVMIAMALICEPELVIADEPTTALDVTTQAQILRLLLQLQQERKMSMLFISHDLDVVGYLADRVLIMYAGEVVEELPVERLETPSHPYTVALQKARPRPGQVQKFVPIPGSLPPPGVQIQGCRFQDRCTHVTAQCRQASPSWTELNSHHRVRCWKPVSNG